MPTFGGKTLGRIRRLNRRKRVRAPVLLLLAGTLLPTVAASEDGPGAGSEYEPEYESAITRRLELESRLNDNPFSITPYKPTYLLPLAYSSDRPVNAEGDELDQLEMKFQVSLKVPISNNLFGTGTQFAFGYTQVAYWQAYNSNYSSPFRETNHEPELMLVHPHRATLGRITSRVFRLGVSHQSNGRSGRESRSWNRVYVDFMMESGDWYLSLKPWWRIPESEKQDPDDPSGDDNPDIHRYMGNFEFSGLYYQGARTYGFMVRNNLRSDNRGALQLDGTFPIGDQMRGYAQLFSGYGESLIDYDRYSNRFSLGVMLTNWL
ncbi:phospholipase A [Thiohalomonas denitrificans]|uniref:phospholipase A n=1 Tax=Thiohalomonas denitrificans TaxID=415747 RepID=UPI0026F2FE6C|nr:phospholipase A [Thiohalomonas denitrificans]